MVPSRRATIGEMVIEHPALARVFEAFDLDYCCGGRVTLAEACAERGVDVAAVMEAIESEPDERPEVDPASMSLCQLADHIERTHHEYLRRSLPRLHVLVERVTMRHEEEHPELGELRRVLVGFVSGIEAHLAEEERFVFPVIRAMERSGVSDSGRRVLDRALAQLVGEHEQAAEVLRAMRSLTGGYVPPEGACPAFHAMLEGLRELEFDMHAHVHLENNVLFPRAASMVEQAG
jgi:regulator of cell morphogenesis and NO signaling